MKPVDPIRELKELFGDVTHYTEAGREFYLVRQLELPEHCVPRVVDVLLCPSERDGYPSRLFFSQRISGRSPNWNTEARIVERTWFAFSWKVPHSGLRPAQLIAAHLKGLA